MSSHDINIENLIKLSSFTVTDEERNKIEKELYDFLEYAEVINESSCNDIKAAAHAVEKKAYQREDVVESWDKLESLLCNGPLTEDTSYLVPPQKGRTGEEKEIEEGKQTPVEAVDYEAVIGLEVHAQLKTKSKLFCNCSIEFGKHPNNNTCPVCSGQPGVLPVLNKEAVNMAILAGLATNCTINKKSIFARKNYFYPDLPKGYQISQFEEPICSDGYVEIELEGKKIKIRLNRIHMEEDAGKMVHIGAPGIWGSKASAVDFNRTSTPLIEIVTEPDISSARVAKEYVIMLRAILVSLGICDGNMEEGSLRCDANISIRKVGDKKLGTKTEVKNMNSFKAIERAIDFEINRQIKLKKMGQSILQCTRLWDENSQKTHLMRTKEESHDYRYFPDPDLLPLILEEDQIEAVRKKLPMMPLERKKRCIEQLGFNEDEATLFMTNPDFVNFFDETLTYYSNPRVIANWFFNELLFYVSGGMKDIPITSHDFSEFLKKLDSGEISGKIGKSVIKKAFEQNKKLIEIIEAEGLKQITDHKVIEDIIDKIIAHSHKQVEQYKAGKTNIFGYFVGQVMKETKGNANPKIVNEILKLKLDEI